MLRNAVDVRCQRMATAGFCGVPGCDAEARYQLASSGATPDKRCSRHALFDGRVCGRAMRIALVVGTVLFVINQLDVVLSGQLTPLIVAKIALTYLVPFSVSTYSSLAASRL